MRRKGYLRRRATGKTFCITCYWESVKSVSYIFGRIYEIINLDWFLFVCQASLFLNRLLIAVNRKVYMVIMTSNRIRLAEFGFHRWAKVFSANERILQFVN